MNKFFIAIITMMMASHQILASETHSTKSPLYVVAKALVTTPSSMEHENAELSSGMGSGIGLDLGYKLSNHIALEVDISYDHNTIEENLNGVIEDAAANYYTYAVDITYALHMTHAMGLIVKLGYEIEDEEVEKLNISEIDSGIVYGLGLEYAINKNYEIVVEYEHSDIISTRGSSIFSGVKINL